jgi:hypothetical protein
MNFHFGKRKDMPVSDRIDRMCTHIPFSGCKVYLGGLADGYGRIEVNGKKFAVHRLIWELLHGEIPEGKVVAHTCDVRSCCNPDHLFLASQSENMIDAVKKNRAPAQKLTIDEVKAIKLSLEPANKLAEEFSVSARQIRRIRQGGKNFVFM